MGNQTAVEFTLGDWRKHSLCVHGEFVIFEDCRIPNWSTKEFKVRSKTGSENLENDHRSRQTQELESQTCTTIIRTAVAAPGAHRNDFWVKTRFAIFFFQNRYYGVQIFRIQLIWMLFRWIRCGFWRPSGAKLQENHRNPFDFLTENVLFL